MTKSLSFTSYLLLALILFMLGFYLRIADLGVVSFWLDEAYTADSVLIARDGDGFVASVKARINHMPLYFATILTYPGDHSDFSLRYPSVLWSMLTLAVTLRILTHIYHVRRYALLAGFLLMTQSLIIFQSREARMYPMANFLVVTVTYFFLRYLGQSQDKNRLWMGFTIASVLAYLTHIASLALIPAQGIILLWQVITRKIPLKRLFYWGATQALLILPMAVWIGLTFRHHPGRLDWVPGITSERVIYVIGQLYYGYLDLVGVGWERAVFLALILLVVSCLALRKRYWLYWMGLTWGAVVGLIIVSLVLQPVYDERYLSVAIFGYFILLALGYKVIGDFVLARFRFAGMIILCLIIGVHLSLSLFTTVQRFSLGRFSQSFEKQGLLYVKDHAQEDDVLITTSSYLMLNWYMDDLPLNVVYDAQDGQHTKVDLEALSDQRVWIVSINKPLHEKALARGYEPVYQYRAMVVYFSDGID